MAVNLLNDEVAIHHERMCRAATKRDEILTNMITIFDEYVMSTIGQNPLFDIGKSNDWALHIYQIINIIF